MKTFKQLITTIGVFAISVSLASADDKGKTEKKSESKSESSEKATAEAKVPASLKGKLIELKDGKIQDAKIPADKEYYLIYHSASW